MKEKGEEGKGGERNVAVNPGLVMVRVRGRGENKEEKLRAQL